MTKHYTTFESKDLWPLNAQNSNHIGMVHEPCIAMPRKGET